MNIQNVGKDPHVVVNEDAKLPTLVRLTEYCGELKVDFRQIWSPKDNGIYVFTKKGAAFPVEDLDEVLEFLLSARDLVAQGVALHSPRKAYALPRTQRTRRQD